MDISLDILRGIGGYDIIVSHNLPVKEIGTHIYWAHPFVQWLGKFFPIRPYIIGSPIEEEQALFIGNKVFVSPRMLLAIKELG